MLEALGYGCRGSPNPGCRRRYAERDLPLRPRGAPSVRPHGRRRRSRAIGRGGDDGGRPVRRRPRGRGRPGGRRAAWTWPPSCRPATSSRRSGSTPRTAARCCGTRPRTCWPRPCRALFPQAQARHRPADRERLLLRLRRRRRRSPRRPRRASRSGCRRSSSRASGSPAGSSPRTRPAPSWPTSRTSSSSSGSRARRRDATRSMEVGGAELTIYDNLDAKTGERVWRDLCRGPHVPTTRLDPGVQADPQRGGVLAGQREEPAAAAHLRHRVGVAGRAQGAPRAARRGREARPPQARRRARPVLVPRRDRLRARGVPPQGRHRPPGHGGLLAPAARGGRLRVRQHPAHHQGAPVRDLRPPRLVRRRHVPADGARRGVDADGTQRRRSTTSSR